MRTLIVISTAAWLIAGLGMAEAQVKTDEVNKVRTLTIDTEKLSEDLLKQLEELDIVIESLVQEKESLANRIKALENEKGESAKFEEAIGILEDAKRSLEEELENQKLNLGKLEDEVSGLTDQVKEAKEELTRSTTDNDRLRETIEKRSAEIQETQNQIKEIVSEKIELEGHLAQEIFRLTLARRETRELRARIESSKEVEEFSVQTIVNSTHLIDFQERSGVAPATLAVLIDDSVRESYFIVKGSGLSPSLIDPSGNSIEPNKTNFAKYDQYGHSVFRVVDPAAGRWEVRMENASQDSESDPSFTFYARGSTDLLLKTGIRNWYPSGAVLKFDASLSERGLGVEEARLSLTVKKSDEENAVLSNLNAGAQDSGTYQFSLSGEVLPAGEYDFIIRGEGSTVSGSKFSREIKRIVWINDITTNDLLALGREAFIDENWDEAIIMAEYAVDVYPNNVEARRDLGFYYKRKASLESGLSSDERGLLDHKAYLNQLEIERITKEKVGQLGWLSEG